MRPLAFLLPILLIGLDVHAADDAVKLAVLPLSGKRVTAEETQILDDLVVNEVAALNRYQVVSSADVNALLGLDRMKAAFGCNDVACAAELGGALGVNLLVAGTASRLGGEFLVSLQLIDVQQQRVESRSQTSVNDAETAYRGAIQAAVAQLFGLAPTVQTPPPPTARPAGPRTIELSGPLYERFVTAGLDKTAYLDFLTSGVSYPTWAESYNDKTESWVLEASKWVFTGTVCLILPVGFLAKDSTDSWGSAIGTSLALSMPMILSSVALWVIDLSNIGNAPASMPDATAEATP